MFQPEHHRVIYGLASHGKFFGAFKPGNRSRDVKGLYLAGGAAHPTRTRHVDCSRLGDLAS